MAAVGSVVFRGSSALPNCTARSAHSNQGRCLSEISVVEILFLTSQVSGFRDQGTEIENRKIHA